MGMVGQIIIIEGKEQGKKFVLDQRQVFEIGRAQSSTIHIEDSSAAMNHCRVYREEGNVYTIYDLNSTVGTFINGQKITKTEIKNGDKIKIGNILMEFRMEDIQEKEYSDNDVDGFSLDDFSDSYATDDGSLHRSDQYAQESLPPSEPAEHISSGASGYLAVLEGEDKGKEYALEKDGAYLIGRAMNADIKIMDIKASRNHCVVERVGNQFFVQDKSSRNGTYLNGDKIVERLTLVPGAYIKVGFTVFKFDVK